ncbi:MAG: hypothetical protein Q9171_004134 [Xanthocarpia ochracea]
MAEIVAVPGWDLKKTPPQQKFLLSGPPRFGIPAIFTGSSIAKDGILLVYLGLKSLQILQAIIEPAAEMRRKLVTGIQLRATLLEVGQGHVQRAQG